MKGLDTYTVTLKERLKGIAETVKCDEVLAKHYEHILNHFDSIIAMYDSEIAEIEERKTEVLNQFIKAPELLKELARHITELAKKKQDVCGNDKKVKKIRHLRGRLDLLEQACRMEGINIEECLKNIADLEKEQDAEAMAEKIAEGERVAEKERIAAEERGEI